MTFVPDRSATLRAAIRDGNAMRAARARRRAEAAPAAEELGAVERPRP